MALDFKMTTENLCFKRKFEWTINNFSSLSNIVESPSFFPVPGQSFNWIIQLEFSPITGKNYMYVRLKSLDEKNAAPPMRVTGYVILQTESDIWEGCAINEIVTANSKVTLLQLPETGFAHSTLPESLDNYVQYIDDTLVIECDLTVSGILISAITFKEKPRVQPKNENILKIIYERNAFTDFVFHFDEKVIKVHKVVLSAKSPFFERMFKYDTLEQQTNSVAMNDIDFSVFKCFIYYLYMGEISDDIDVDVDLLLDLYITADKYDVADLKVYCSDLLMTDHMNADTVVKILEVADMHSDDLLKEVAMGFLRNIFSEVRETKEWNNFLTKNTKLASDVLNVICLIANQKEDK